MKNKIYIYSTIAIIVLISATFGDLMTKSTAKGGLNFGTMGSSAVLLGLLLIFVILAPPAREEER